MVLGNVLDEATALVQHTADAHLRRALRERGQAVRVVRARMCEVGSAVQDPELAQAIDRADAAWFEVRTWWAFLYGPPDPPPR